MNIFLFRIKIEKYSVNNINTLIVFYTTNRSCFKMSLVKPNVLKSCFKKKSKGKSISWGKNDIRFISPIKIVITISSDLLTKQEIGTIQTGEGIIQDTREKCRPITESRLWKRRHKDIKQTKQTISSSIN